ncbi:hypothetical protein Pmar_PMAR011940 [Perkinsus marinus ATCC 50983]|uniref:Uncharacterized protein n=1 Tax=Perkinsus marinus (strain ATCC 50983 / TXsc) TaxID=423536 RepID=C5LBR3_PERM5|nr:hypothetical protein Pmar_PMAR011940 [Perkinsus marinus ATCC 50983]EER05884.1 hypothetical protein Pmar_PMAR011940 [Perkinsus marinus ATCC 50983]|eukprot:XP_002774068.1 hypothetical protein Pmar_PMAR011940 [Perkinsus marinus ATCC 50983]
MMPQEESARSVDSFAGIDREIAAARKAYAVDHFHLLSLLDSSLRLRRTKFPDSHPEVQTVMRDLCLACNEAVQAWMRDLVIVCVEHRQAEG